MARIRKVSLLAIAASTPTWLLGGCLGTVPLDRVLQDLAIALLV